MPTRCPRPPHFHPVPPICTSLILDYSDAFLCVSCCPNVGIHRLLRQVVSLLRRERLESKLFNFTLSTIEGFYFFFFPTLPSYFRNERKTEKSRCSCEIDPYILPSFFFFFFSSLPLWYKNVACPNRPCNHIKLVTAVCDFLFNGCLR